ncbi:hypothetical protein HMPREF9374_0846 [Desmospora sp. 8437]|nr:hypothetical protein HMPREF9374_0846 [Desmospora sp. 8437]
MLRSLQNAGFFCGVPGRKYLHFPNPGFYRLKIIVQSHHRL